jgi:serine/threonine protein kinase
MIFKNPETLKQRITEVTQRPAHSKITVFEDTSQFMSIDAGSVLRLGGNDYLVLGYAREGRFGLDEQPKFWVKTVIDLTTGERKIVKLVFHETFNSRIGSTVFTFVRSPQKESEILQRMRGHPNFMQGKPVSDAVGNPVRVIDFIPGPSLYEYLRRLDMPHEVYYRQIFFKLIKPVIECIDAIAQLHRQGMHHGDIRADHILLKEQMSDYVWIDFDYAVDYPDYDLCCLGNILLQVAGKGRHSLYDIGLRPSAYPGVIDTLAQSDMSLMFRHRVANLRKLFPHISAALNDILMRFSVGSTDPYCDVEVLLADLRVFFPEGAQTPN